MAGKDTLIHGLVEPVVKALGCELWGIDYQSQGRNALVRIYIDSPNGIGVDDCANVSRQVGCVFDVEDPIAGEYTLEVSSPGMERPLFTKEQIARYVGERIQVRLRTAFEGRRNFSGQLVAVEDEDVVMLVDDHEYLLPYEMIDKANLVAQF